MDSVFELLSKHKKEVASLAGMQEKPYNLRAHVGDIIIRWSWSAQLVCVLAKCLKHPNFPS